MKNRNRPILLLNIIMAFIVLFVGIQQYKIGKYNSELNLLKERINGKVVSTLFIGLESVRESILMNKLALLVVNGISSDAKAITDQIIKKQREIIISTCGLTESPTDGINREIANIIEDANLSYEEKYKQLGPIHDKCKGLFASYFDRQYDRVNLINKKMFWANLIQTICLIAIFIVSSLISVFAFKGDKPSSNIPTNIPKKRTRKAKDKAVS